MEKYFSSVVVGVGGNRRRQLGGIPSLHETPE